MSEVHRYRAVKMQTEVGNNISYNPHGPEIVLAADFDRVIAERDALQQDLNQRDEQIATLESQREAWLRNSQAAERRVEVLEADKRTMSEAYILYTWLRKKCDQPSNDVVVVNMNIGHDWVPVHDLDRDLRTMIDREEP